MQQEPMFKKTQTLLLENPIVIRKVPMNEHGCNMIRAIRGHIKNELQEKEGISVDIRYPTAIHLMMQDYCAIKGIEVTKA